MVVHVCSKCNKEFNHKGIYNRHLKRKYSCVEDTHQNLIKSENKPIFCKWCNKTFTAQGNLSRHIKHYCKEKQGNKVDNKEVSDNQCPYCLKTFSSVSSRRRHVKNYCKVKDNVEKNKEHIYQMLLKNKNSNNDTKVVNAIKSNVNSIVNSNNTNSGNTINITQQNSNHIKLVAFGKEDLSYIPVKMSMRLLKTGFMSVPNTAEYVHFNLDTPQFHNIYIPNMKEPYAMAYDGKKWNLIRTEDALHELYDGTKYFLSEKFEEFYESLDRFAKRKFGKFLEESEDKFVVKSIKERLKLLLYNNKDIPMETRKKIKNDKNKTLK